MRLMDVLRKHAFSRSVEGGKVVVRDCATVAEIHAANTVTMAEWDEMKSKAKVAERARLESMRRDAAAAARVARHDLMAEGWEADHAKP